MEREPDVAVSGCREDVVLIQDPDHGRFLGRSHGDHRTSLVRAARGDHPGTDAVESFDEEVREPADMLVGGSDSDLVHQVHSGDAGVDVGNRRRSALELAGGRLFADKL